MNIKNIGLPSTQMNDVNSTLYAKVMNIKTDVTNNNPAIPSITKYSTPTRLFYRIFTYTTNTFEEITATIRVKTGGADSENTLKVSQTPKNFSLAFVKEEDSSISIYVKCNQYEQVKFQLIEGSDNNVTYYYSSPLSTDITDLTQLPITSINDNVRLGDILVNSITFNTKVNGEGFVPIRDGSIPMGGANKRWKGGYFTDRLGFPTLITGTPSNPQNGDTFFHATSKKICTYYGGKWYSNGVEVTPT